MFERFTERARQVVVLAQEEARSFNHSFIGTEHILLGLVREEEGLAARVLRKHNLGASSIRHAISTMVGKGENEVTVQQIPFTPRAKKVLELSLREALSLGHNYIGTEHILLALSREEDGVTHRIFDISGITKDFIRDDVIAVLSGPGSRKSEKEQLAEERKKREWEAQRRTEAESSSSDGQSESEPNFQKAQGTFTYGDWTLQIEEDTSGQPSIQIKSPFGSLSATFRK